LLNYLTPFNQNCQLKKALILPEVVSIGSLSSGVSVSWKSG
jgi:hypothetical protein